MPSEAREEINLERKPYSEIIWWDLFQSSPAAVPTPIRKDVIFRNLRQIKDDATSPLHSFDILQGDADDIRGFKFGLNFLLGIMTHIT